MSLTDLIPAQYRVAALAVGAIVLLGLGAGGGAATAWWLTDRHYSPQLEVARAVATSKGEQLVACTAARDNLVELTGEQGKALGQLQRAADDRAQNAALAQNAAHAQAQTDYQAANRLQQERIGGDPAAAAESIIDKELGL
ncbi:hypothetical protein [Pseudomonas kuykendallii]|uniref:hypothetical protein n=1 Tax=Pseudomonas kuykendallii TaxID=1007099 RepID=UPI0028D7CD96|nr:hypothetical protein [Pseudomonas kuykendallii]